MKSTFLIFMMLLSYCAMAQRIVSTQFLLKHDNVTKQNFGFSVCLDDDKIYVGGIGGADVSGVVDVFDSNSGEQLSIISKDLTDTKFFGYDVDVCGDYMVVGSGTGKKFFLYKKDSDGNWIEKDSKEVSASSYVSVDGKNVVVSLYNTSSLEFFTINDEDKLVSVASFNDGDKNQSCDVKGNVAAVACKETGIRIYEFDGSEWVFSTAIEPSVEGSTIHFNNVSIEGELVVFANKGSLSNDKTGSVFVVEKQSDGSWIQVANFVCPKDEFNTFGHIVRAADGMIAVATNKKSNICYIYAKDKAGMWRNAIVLKTQNAADQIGYAMDFDGKRVVATNNLAKPDGVVTQGEAYVFDISELDVDDIVEKLPTDVKRMSVEMQDGQYYDLQGHRIDIPSKGIYVQNGRIVLVK